MSKKGLPNGLTMRHDWHYVEELSKTRRSIGRVLPIAQIEPNPLQPRVEIGDLSELAQSIKERGVLEPLLVKPLPGRDKWLIIAGERRWRAANLAGLSEVPCVELDLDEQQIAEIALIENLQRKDLTVWEEADGFASLSRRFGYTHEEIAQKINRSRTSVTESLTIAALPPAVREKCAAAKIKTKSAILHIARQFDDQEMFAAIDKIAARESAKSTANVKNANSSETYSERDATANAEDVRNGKVDLNIDATAARGNELNSRAAELKTDLRHPVRLYNYQPPQKDFKLALKFKKPVERQAIIKVLQDIIKDLEQD